MTSKKEIIYRWYNEVWINGRWELIDEVYDPTNSATCIIPGATAASHEAREIVTALTNLIWNPKLSILHTIEDGDWVTAFVEMTGIKAGTDRQVDLRWLTMSRIENNKIVESYPHVNLLSFFEQLGQLPQHSFELLLAGTKLR